MKRYPLKVRENWRDLAKNTHLLSQDAEGETYWDETAYYSFDFEEVENVLKPAIQELHNLCMAFIDSAINSEEIMHRLGIPNFMFDRIQESWKLGCKSLMGRFDLVYDGTMPPKMLEYNADTPGMLFEMGHFQLQWLSDLQRCGDLPASFDQFNSFEKLVVEFFENIPIGKRIHFSCLKSSQEDFCNLSYIQNCARFIGHETFFTPIDVVKLNERGYLENENGKEIDVWFRYYPWEWMVHEPLGTYIPFMRCSFIEPEWKMILASKASLAYLWKMFKGHPLLLPTYFTTDSDVSDIGPDFVIKPSFAREGSNVAIFKNGSNIDYSVGPYNANDRVVQKYVELPKYNNKYTLLGGWVINHQPAGICIREDKKMITGNTSHFLPHTVVR